MHMLNTNYKFLHQQFPTTAIVGTRHLMSNMMCLPSSEMFGCGSSIGSSSDVDEDVLLIVELQSSIILCYIMWMLSFAIFVTAFSEMYQLQCIMFFPIWALKMLSLLSMGHH